MLSIGKLGRGQENYYLATVASGIEDYYTGSGEAPGEWTGAGAARLGLTGEVEAEDLRKILGGVDPKNDDPLGGHTRKDRVPGWDLTFSAPKSVSVLYALGGEQVSAEVVAAHRAAVAAGIGYLERHATVSRRRVDGAVEVVRGEGLVVAAFRHRTSRAGDPQLHTHCVAANVVERVDGGWGALHSPFLYRHARTAGFVYQAVLRGELSLRLGVRWGDITNGYADIEGIDRRLIDRFSKRREEIEAAMAARGEHSPEAAQAATLATRQAKDYGVDPQTLAERWAAEAGVLGRDIADVSHAVGGQPVAVRISDLDAVVDEMLSAHGLTKEAATFDRRDVVRAWCAGLPAGAHVSLDALDELVEGVLEEDRVVSVVDGRSRLADRQVVRRADGRLTTALAVERRWSTTEMLAVEERLLERGARAAGGGVAFVDGGARSSVLQRDPTLSSEQVAMVEQITGSGNGVDVVVGRAGTGKTYALAAAARVWRSAGYRPIGVAIAARAAVELEGVAGIPSTTVAQFLIDCEQSPEGLSDRHVVIVDEASMIDTRRLGRLLAHADAAGAKAVLVGDHHQLPAVEAGGGFAGLVRRLGAVELTENRRQQEPWERAALARLRTGVGGRGGLAEIVARYDGHGRVHIGATPAEVRQAMVADWYAYRRAGGDPIMLALRRHDVADLNARARQLLLADGSVASSGMTVQARTFAVGDRVVCRQNDRRLGVHNALFGRVVAAAHDELVVLAESTSRQVVVPRGYAVDGHLDHAYATTIHKAQGASYSHALLLGDDRLYRQAGYTGLSRGKVRNDIYLVDDDDDRDLVGIERHGTADVDEPASRLVSSLARDGAKHLATDQREPTAAWIPSRSLRDLWALRDTADHDGQVVERLDRAIDRRAAAAGRAAEIERPDHIVERLGQPPVDLDRRQRWRTAAGAIESYRARWGDDALHTTSSEWSEAQLAHAADVERLSALTILETAEPAAVELA